MKRLMSLCIGAVFSIISVILLFGSVLAHNGAIMLYSVHGANMVSNQNVGFLQNDTISIFYVKDLGYDLGTTVQFALQVPSPWVILWDAHWSHKILYTNDGTGGFVLMAGDCMGVGQEIVYIGEIEVWFFWVWPHPNSTLPFTLRVVATDFYNGQHPPGIYITRCDPEGTFEPILGGAFFYNCENCEQVAVQPKTWGAIKEVYR